MHNAKRQSVGPPEQKPYFMEAMNSPLKWVYKDGKWRPRKHRVLSEEHKAKISEAMKGNKNRSKKDEEILH